MIGYWLVPAEPARTWFSAQIAELARRYDAPVFDPHVSVYSSEDDEDYARVLMKRVAPEFTSIQLTIEAVSWSEKFTRTLFVQFAQSSQVQQLSDSLRAGSRSRREYELNPHLSLLYALVSGEAKAAEAHRIALPFDDVEFDAISAISFSKSIKTRADVEAWRTIGGTQLSG